MHAYLASFRDLCLFRRGPEDIPYSPSLLIALLVACGVLQVGFNRRDGASPALVIGSLIGGLAIVGIVFLLLRGRDKSERFVQTTTVLAAVYLLFDIVTNLLTLLLPMKELREHLLSQPTHLPSLTGSQTLVMLAIAALGIWQLCVWVGTLRRALEIPRAGSVLVFLMLVFVNLIVTAVVASLIGVA
ncbi:MAG: YIP1 family protein [Rhodanobacteraceae bacterium]